MIKNKKGMEVGELYQFVLLIVLVGLVLGVGVLVLGKLSESTGLDRTTIAVLGNTTEALAPVADTWLPLIVTIASLAIILALVIRAFSARGR